MKFKLILSSTNKKDNETTANFTNTLSANFNSAYKLRLVSCAIPLTYYNVNNTNNKIYFVEHPNSHAVATLTNGYYTTNTLATHVASVMSAASPNTYTYTCSYNTTSNAFIISVSASTFKLEFNDSKINSAYKLLGFNKSDTNTASSHTSVYQPMLNLTNVICVRSSELSSRLIRSNIINQMYDNILQIIPINVAIGELLYYNNPNDDFFEIDAKNLNKIDLFLTDIEGNQLDLRGVDCHFEFEIISVY